MCREQDCALVADVSARPRATAAGTADETARRGRNTMRRGRIKCERHSICYHKRVRLAIYLLTRYSNATGTMPLGETPFELRAAIRMKQPPGLRIPKSVVRVHLLRLQGLAAQGASRRQCLVRRLRDLAEFAGYHATAGGSCGGGGLRSGGPSAAGRKRGPL